MVSLGKTVRKLVEQIVKVAIKLQVPAKMGVILVKKDFFFKQVGSDASVLHFNQSCLVYYLSLLFFFNFFFL